MKRFSMICLLLMLPFFSFAQEAKRQSLNFEDELIEGATQKPELSILLEKRDFNYKRLIKLRKNFLPEIRRSSEKIQRSGRSD